MEKNSGVDNGASAKQAEKTNERQSSNAPLSPAWLARILCPNTNRAGVTEYLSSVFPEFVVLDGSQYRTRTKSYLIVIEIRRRGSDTIDDIIKAAQRIQEIQGNGWPIQIQKQVLHDVVQL